MNADYLAEANCIYLKEPWVNANHLPDELYIYQEETWLNALRRMQADCIISLCCVTSPADANIGTGG